jgi:phage terminase large subunit-like protein
MAATKEPASFPGILRGAGKEANCTVWATKVSLSGEPSVFEYVNYSIKDVAEPLPDGDYELLAHGKTIAVRNKDGYWLSAPTI